jgi:hypothetical protein
LHGDSSCAEINANPERRLRTDYPIEPVDLANMRQNGVGSLAVVLRCRHEMIKNVARSASMEVSRVREQNAQGMWPGDIAKALVIGRASVYRLLAPVS